MVDFYQGDEYKYTGEMIIGTVFLATGSVKGKYTGNNYYKKKKLKFFHLQIYFKQTLMLEQEKGKQFGEISGI